MKFNAWFSTLAGLLALGAVSAKADVEVGTIAAPPQGANGCSWAIINSTGSYPGSGTVLYTLSCPSDPNIISIYTTAGSCYWAGPIKAGYKAAYGCNAKVYRVDGYVPPAEPISNVCTSPNKGKVYYQGPYTTALSILQTSYPQNFCGDCKVEMSATGDYAATRTIYCSSTKL